MGKTFNTSRNKNQELALLISTIRIVDINNYVIIVNSAFHISVHLIPHNLHCSIQTLQYTHHSNCQMFSTVIRWEVSQQKNSWEMNMNTNGKITHYCNWAASLPGRVVIWGINCWEVLLGSPMAWQLRDLVVPSCRAQVVVGVYLYIA